ncbi:MAG: hypothetical protein DWB42_03820 [Chloroflexi bacterium]|nr:hypothetical protein [Chloroflexota bacterium]MDL1882106.1 hypothetical protein [Anaerolineae bacterium CFX8]
MRLKLLAVVMGGAFLLLAGQRPDALPYFNTQARYSDVVIAHWPNALYLNQNGFAPWRETILAGQPFAANPLNKTAYPLQWFALLLPPALHLNLMVALHLLIAGAGMWRWTRLLGLRAESAALSALAYALAPRLTAHLGAGHLDIVYALAWWPWLMSAARLVVDSGKISSIFGLALAAALVLLADVRVSLYALATVFLYMLFMAGGRRRVWQRALGAGALALPMTASVIAPLLAWSPYLSRADLSAGEAGMLAIQPGHFLGLAIFPSPPGVETLVYGGLPALALALVGWWLMERRARALTAAGLVGAALYAMGANGPLWPMAVNLVPGLLWFRVPSRVWLIAALALPLLAGLGLERLLALAEGRRVILAVRRWRLAAAGLTAVVVALGLFALAVLKLPEAGVGALVFGGTSGAALLLALNGRLSARRLPTVWLALVFFDLVWFGTHWVTWRGPEVWLEPHRPLAERLIALNADRVYSPTYSLEQQVAEVYGLRLFGGVDPFQLVGIVQAVEQGSGVMSAGYSVIQPPIYGVQGDDLSSANRDAVMETGVLAAWRVSHVVAAYPISHPRLEWVDTVNGVYIYANRNYTPAPAERSVPDWPAGWPNLPDADTVNGLNRLTESAALVSAIGLVAAAGLFLYFALRTEG